MLGTQRDRIFVDNSYGKFLALQAPLKKRTDSLRYDMFEQTLEDACWGIMKQIEWLQQRQPEGVYNPNLTNLAGSIDAKYILVGDQTNPNKLKHSPWPFFDAGASSYYLCEQLNLAGIPETMFCMVNGFIRDPDQNNMPIIDYKVGAMIDDYNLTPVGLGQRATEAIPQACRFIPHPSYAKRFNIPDYHKQLKAALS